MTSTPDLATLPRRTYVTPSVVTVPPREKTQDLPASQSRTAVSPGISGRSRAQTVDLSPLPVVSERLQDRRRLGMKRLVDLSVSAAVVPVALPVMGIVAALVCLDSPGPVLFRQTRLGRNGQPFGVLKFRSMRADADRDPEIAFADNPAALAEWRRTHKLRCDPRLTRVGRILRRTSLDELPQLLNVFKGEMSLVGPRPIVHDETMRYGKHLPSLHQVKPGLTGLWQVSGRNETTYRRRVALDAAYVRHWSLRLDAALLAKTVKAVIKGRGAY